ncbi:MAG: S-layer homology domain-containing protein [Lachnospiraceae bacterium]|nr:S-layer homology domain-containing protein [Lachnospiraceae bacterium]
MKVTKKILAAVLMLMLVLGSIMFTPGQAKADEYALIVGGQSFNSSQAASASLSGTGWNWNGETRELQITTGYNGGRIYYAGSCTIYTYNTQLISSNTADPAIKVDGKLTLYSTGQLTVNSFASVNTILAGGDIDFHIDSANIFINGYAGEGQALRLVQTPATVYVGGQGSLNLTGRSESGDWLVGIDAKSVSTGNWPDSKVEINIDVEGNADSTYGGASVTGIFINTGNIYLVAEDCLNIRAKNTTDKQGYGIMQYAENARIYVNSSTGQHHIAGNTQAIACSPGHNITMSAKYYQIGEKTDKDLYLITSNAEQIKIGDKVFSGSDFDTSFSYNGYYWDAETGMLIMEDPNTLYERVYVVGKMLIIKAKSGDEPFFVRSTGGSFFSSEGGLAIISDRQTYIYSDNSYSTIDVADSLFLCAHEPLTIHTRAGELGYIDAVVADEVVAFGGGHINISAYIDEGDDYSEGISTRRLLVGVSENDYTKLGVTITGENLDHNNGILLNYDNAEIITRGHANLDVNAYNYSKEEYSNGYAINTYANSIKAADFSWSMGEVKLFGSTAAVADSVWDYVIGLPYAQYDDRYIEKFDPDAWILFIDDQWIEGDAIYENASGSGWSYDPYTRSITLNGYNGPSIYANGGAFDIILADGSNNTITGYVYIDAALRFRGGGNLTIIDDNEGFSPLEASGSIIFKGTGKITIKQENMSADVKDGILSGGDVFIFDQTVEVKQSGNNEYYYDSPIAGLHNHGMLLVTGKLTVDSNLVTQELPYNIRLGIYNEDGSVVVLDKGTINSREKAAGFSVGVSSDTPLILDGSAGPIIFQGDAQGVGVGSNIRDVSVLYNSAYTERKYGEYDQLVIYTTSGNYYELATKATKTLKPSIGAATSCTWTSSNSKVASVSSKGVVTAKIYGDPVIIRATLKSDPTKYEEWIIQTRYYDVTSSKKYYFKPVYWAADQGITKGYDNVYFGVGENCTRGAVMVFLWRLAGKPDVTGVENPFSDVKESELGSTYYKAILWGVDQGITKGYSDGTFRPNGTILRKDIMIMLYRFKDKPYWYFTEDRPASGFTFTDVIGVYEPGTDTYNAIAWGYTNGITNGYPADSPYAGQFGAKLNCKREDIVTFLYRMESLVN